MRIVKKVLAVNKKWYLILCIAAIVNIGWNFVNSSVAKAQNDRITGLEIENLSLKKTNIELLSKNFSGQHILDRLPFSLWKKRLYNGDFIMKFINDTGKDQFLTLRGIDRFYYYNKTDFDVFPYTEARKFFLEDSIVAYAKSDTIAHFNTDFYDASGKFIIKDGYTRWREIIDNDTIIWGKMDRFYIKPIDSKN